VLHRHFWVARPGLQGELTVERMCAQANVSRAGYYRSFRQAEPDEEEAQLRDAIQRIAIEKRHYGYRRVSRELQNQGRVVNHKRVARLMREDNLLAIRKRRFVPVTTDSEHRLEVSLNLARHMKLTGINQLWVADITYIRLQRKDVFLAVVLDAFSRMIVGWNLGRSLQSELALAALQRALESRRPPAGLIHHSDRGVQYACKAYMELLKTNGMVPSMSRAGNPYDNAKCESFMKTLKKEEIYCTAYRDEEDLRAHLEQFIETYYNRQRLHSALAYQSPEEFELSAAPCGETTVVPSLSFPRHEEIYPDALS
jgi:putative transposase